MTQFASTLYPQTNPSNPVLLAYRDHKGIASPVEWIDYTDRCYISNTSLDRQHVRHAKKVLIRLASFSG